MAGTYGTINLPANGVIKPYTNLGVFPTGTFEGEMAVAQDTGLMYYWDTTTWVEIKATAVGGGGSSNYKPEPVITLNATNISNKYVVLTEAPTDKNKTRLVVIGGIHQEYAADFVVTADDGGKRLSWSGLGLDGVLEDGDKLLVVYN